MMDQLAFYYDRFQKISPITRRVIFSVLFLLLLRIGVALWHHGYSDLSSRVDEIAVVGLVWSTGAWRVLKKLFVVLVWYLRVFH
ncbi:MAG: hypothetical protein KGQ57_00185 [Burkholderiales bacterium]|nr:hypothetical protein [Burkholderiales bacterium]